MQGSPPNEPPAFSINSLNSQKKAKPWVTNLDTNSSMVDLKIDSGAEINELPQTICITNFNI